MIKPKKPLVNLRDKNEDIVHIRNLKQALNYGLVLKKIHKVIQFNRKSWLKSYVDMNTEIRKKWVWKIFLCTNEN